MIRSQLFALVATALTAAAFTPSAAAQCVGGGPGGPIPLSGTGGGGIYPNTLPPLEFQGDIAVTVPAGATCLTSVKLQGLSHTWNNDVQFVLADPSGAWHNLLRGPNGFDYAGDYEVFDRVRLGTVAPFGWGINPVPSGQGVQDFGGWPTGTVVTTSSGSTVTIDNTPLEQIPISSGTWTLYAFDWVGGDSGTLTSFELCFGTPFVPPPPPPASGCFVGTGGNIPVSGTGGGGVFPTTFPVTQFTSTLNVPAIPPGASVITRVKLNGLTHTWGGDVQFVLTSPSGISYNVGCAMPGDPNADWNFIDVSIIDSRLAGGCSPTASTGLYVAGAPATGTYAQEFGGWVDGTNNVFNKPLEQIPIAAGAWKLEAYDWVGGDSGSITSWELCFGSPSNIPSQGAPFSNQCVAGGAPAAAFPASGAADGVWPTTLPTGEIISSAVITAPGGGVLEGVKLIGFQHAWGTDAMVVLQDPAGNQHMLLQRDNGSNCSGCGDDFNGDYTIVDTCGTANTPIPACGAGVIPTGEIPQTFGTWPTGSAGINNTPISQIPVTSGTWTLKVYDWCPAFDGGFLTSWELCFAGPAAPVAYCTAGTTTSGCNASISAANNPSASLATPCNINVVNVEGQKSGLIFYSVAGQQIQPWNTTSFLCVKAPTQRTLTQNSGGTVGTCSGTLSLDWNGFQAANPTAVGNPWSSGNTVQVQAWFRDPPAGKSTNLSNAIQMTYTP